MQGGHTHEGLSPFAGHSPQNPLLLPPLPSCPRHLLPPLLPTVLQRPVTNNALHSLKPTATQEVHVVPHV